MLPQRPFNPDVNNRRNAITQAVMQYSPGQPGQAQISPILQQAIKDMSQRPATPPQGPTAPGQPMSLAPPPPAVPGPPMSLAAPVPPYDPNYPPSTYGG